MFKNLFSNISPKRFYVFTSKVIPWTLIISIILIFVVACTSMKLTNTADSCILFDEKKNWYKATKKSYDKWNVQ